MDQLFNENSLLSFEDLRTAVNIPRTSFYFYLCLRSALKCNGTPWGRDLEAHPVIKLIFDNPIRGLVSLIYRTLMKASIGKLPIVKKWERDLNIEENTIDWDAVWDNIFHCSKNPNHQLIHLNICHRTHWTLHRRCITKAIPNPYCTFCHPDQTKTFLHMVWECEEVQNF